MRAQLAGIRRQEAAPAVRMARIRAVNMAMIFFIMPVASFITFAVARAALLTFLTSHPAPAPLFLRASPTLV
jgi:hypothetical protein